MPKINTMKKTLTVLAMTAALSLSAQKNVVKIYFPEEVAIQDISKPIHFGAYEPVLTGKKWMKFVSTYEDGPMHLIVHTKDNKSYNLVILPSEKKEDLPRYEWRRKDKALDLAIESK